MQGSRNNISAGREINIADYSHVSLDSAVVMAIKCLKEAVFHIAAWSLKYDVSEFMPVVDGIPGTLEGFKHSANGSVTGGYPLRNLSDRAKELYDVLVAIGVTAVNVSSPHNPGKPIKKEVGYRLWSFGEHMARHSEIELSLVRFPAEDYEAIVAGVNSVIADTALDSVGLGSGRRLAYEFLRNYCAQNVRNGGANGQV